jgi:adhesin/invasin
MDIVVANSGTNNILLFYGNGNGTFGNKESYPLGYDYRPYSIAVNDLNHDGWMDIVIACYGTDHIEILMKTC